jgi:hypothetical protein
MKIIVAAINEAAPRACDLYPFPLTPSRKDGEKSASRKDAPSNIGRKVVLRGLVSRQDLNGCYATIVDEPRFARAIFIFRFKRPDPALFCRQQLSRCRLPQLVQGDHPRETRVSSHVCSRRCRVAPLPPPPPNLTPNIVFFLHRPIIHFICLPASPLPSPSTCKPPSRSC